MADKTISPSLKNNQRAKSAKGGARPGAGRPKGSPDKVTRTLKELAREYTAEALEALVAVLKSSDSDAARVSAANAILDRGYGKPSTVLAGDEDGGAVRMIHEIILKGVAPQ